ncbi:MAG: glutaminyl-peptide cyclotransferase [Sedimentisphaerales bacterium]|nr:glutaminyl-peptide cyclotransferase [Sedimentisphaerales bacterium]
MNRFIKLLIPGLIAISAVAFIVFGLDYKVPDTSSIYKYKIINSYPHDREAFTQGLVYEDGILYEGTGRNGYSELRKVELETGNVLQKYELSEEYFGEGITVYGDKIVQLTYLSNVGFVYKKDTFELLRDFNYPTPGWGITNDGKYLIMSDGTPKLYFLDTETFGQVRCIEVYDQGVSVWGLNELEYVKGQIFANVWPTERIARISPKTGRVIGWINMGGLLTKQDHAIKVDVFNGIAYDKEKDRLFVTGKFWPKLFEIKLIPVK